MRTLKPQLVKTIYFDEITHDIQKKLANIIVNDKNFFQKVTLKREFTTQGRPSCMAYSADGKELAFAAGTIWSPGAVIEIWRSATGRLLQTLNTERYVNWIAYRPHNNQLACATFNSIIIFDTKNGHLLCTLPGIKNMDTLAYSPNGRQLAAGESFNENIKIWNIRNDGVAD